MFSKTSEVLMSQPELQNAIKIAQKISTKKWPQNDLKLPIIAQKWPKIAQIGPKITQNGQKISTSWKK